ncbi:MAG: RsbRD N-terminal domain-containing protein [Deltaproteobacteria bacterium]|nr:RsbRD N-terminal domain-containing protein [Deltaproteobacteria bacterium]
MDLKEFLLENRVSILDKWVNFIFDTYPADTASFLRRQKDEFANPVGSNVRAGLEEILDHLITAMPAVNATRNTVNWEQFHAPLDRIIRVRAIQSFTPSQAIAFILGLKPIVRTKLGQDVVDHTVAGQLTILEALIDDLLFMAFDIYCACRDTLADIRIKDEHRRLHLLLKRAKLICTEEENGPVLPDFREDGVETH